MNRVQTNRLSAGNRIALIAFLGGLAGMFSGVALDHAYPGLNVWIWRAIFWPSLTATLIAIAFQIFDLSIKSILARFDKGAVKSATSKALGFVLLGALFGPLLIYSVTHPGEPAPEPPPRLPVVPMPPVVMPPISIVAPPGQRPLLSSAAKFIFACYAAKQTAGQAAKQKAFLQNSLKPWGEQIGFDISMADTTGGFRVTVEAKTDEAKNRFLAFGVLPVVAVVFIDVQQFGPQIIVVASADLPKQYKAYSLVTPNASAAQIVEAQQQIGFFLALPDNACHLI
jgi:hypothetical protein